MSADRVRGTRSGFMLEAKIAQDLHVTFSRTNSDMTSRRRADAAQVVLNTLSGLTPWELEQFKDTMLDYVTLTEESKREVLSRLCAKMTTLEIG